MSLKTNIKFTENFSIIEMISYIKLKSTMEKKRNHTAEPTFKGIIDKGWEIASLAY